MADVVSRIVDDLNKNYPNAELEGAAYRDPQDEGLANGVLVVMTGQTPLDDAVLDVLAEGGEVTEPPDFDWTRCAKAGTGSDISIACTTRTSPSVTVRYGDADNPVYTMDQVAGQASAFLERLGGGAPEPDYSAEPTPKVTPTTDQRAEFKPKRSDFNVGIKLLRKQCFGSAGCNITYRIAPKYVGHRPLPDNGTIEVTYKVSGAEDEIVGTFTVEAGQADYSKELASTSSSSKKLRAKVTDVTYDR